MIPFILRLASQLASDRIAGRWHRARIRMALFAAASVLFLVALGFGVASGWLLLEPHVGAAYASLIVAGAFAACALLLALIARLLAAPVRRSAESTVPILLNAEQTVPLRIPALAAIALGVVALLSSRR